MANAETQPLSLRALSLRALSLRALSLRALLFAATHNLRLMGKIIRFLGRHGRTVFPSELSGTDYDDEIRELWKKVAEHLNKLRREKFYLLMLMIYSSGMTEVGAAAKDVDWNIFPTEMLKLALTRARMHGDQSFADKVKEMLTKQLLFLSEFVLKVGNDELVVGPMMQFYCQLSLPSV